MGVFGKSAQQKRIDSDALVIADLRTKLAAAETAESSIKRQLSEEKQRRSRTIDLHIKEMHRANRIAGRLADAHRALRDIKHMATPHCAHVGRKMADRADAALPSDMGGHATSPVAVKPPVAAAEAH